MTKRERITPTQPQLGETLTMAHATYVQLLELVTMHLLNSQGRRVVLSREDARSLFENHVGLGVAMEGDYITVEVVENKDMDRKQMEYEEAQKRFDARQR